MARIALVVLDTLRKDHFDRHFDWLPGVRFSEAYSTANWTAPAHASMFTGLYPREVGVTAKSRSLDCEQSTVAEELHEAGFETIGFSANNNASAINQFDRGFQDFVGPSGVYNPGADLMNFEEFLCESEVTGLPRYLRAVAQCILGDHDTIPSLRYGVGKAFGKDSLMKRIDDDGAKPLFNHILGRDWAEDAFLFLNLMEAHTPYDPPEPYNRVDDSVSISITNTFSGVENPDKARAAYDGAAEYLSAVYRDAFEELSATFDYVITLSDHGELLGEHGWWNHTYSLYPEVTRVPMVITDTNSTQDRTVETPVSIMDVYNTIRDLAGLGTRRRGQSLTDPRDVRARELLAEYRGLIPVAEDRLSQVGFSDGEIEDYEEPLDAIVGPDGGYRVFRGDDVEFSAGGGSTDLRTRYEEVVQGLESVETTEEELSEVAKQRLERLGYA